MSDAAAAPPANAVVSFVASNPQPQAPPVHYVDAVMEDAKAGRILAPNFVLIPPVPDHETRPNLDEITLRQLTEDVKAYQYDLNWCQAMLDNTYISPQERRTYQLRILDLSHQIRTSQHRIESVRVKLGRPLNFNIGVARNGPHHVRAVTGIANANDRGRAMSSAVASGPTNGIPGAASKMIILKRPNPLPPPKKRKLEEEDDDETELGAAGGNQNGIPLANGNQNGFGTPSMRYFNNSAGPDLTTPHADSPDGGVWDLQRKGYWKCRLCQSEKYLDLPPTQRFPAMPGNYPLKDIAKMITHYTDLHREHDSDERCVELGKALSVNMGPFEYWLRKTKHRGDTNHDLMQACIDELLSGRLPDLLRSLSSAAARFTGR